MKIRELLVELLDHDPDAEIYPWVVHPMTGQREEYNHIVVEKDGGDIHLVIT